MRRRNRETSRRGRPDSQRHGAHDVHPFAFRIEPRCNRPISRRRSNFRGGSRVRRKYGVLPPLARAMAMSGGFHLSVFDLDGAETIHTDARELARSLNFMPTIVSSGIDLLFVHVRRNDVGRAQVLLPEVESAAAATPGWHDWLWHGRLKQVRGELALACGDARLRLRLRSGGDRLWRGNGRIKYEALGQITAARALRALGRTHEAITHARDALAVARLSSDPALLLWALNVNPRARWRRRPCTRSTHGE